MLRTFREHEIRRVESLDGLWDFITAINHKGRRLPTRFDTTLWVPSCWELQSGLENYRGQAWYHTHIQSRPGLATRLVFGGVSHTADVFVDGRKTAHHYDAYTPFEVILPPGTGVTHDLVVRVDNTFGPHSSLHMENDYMTYGGITRPVELQHVPVVFIERMHATPRRSGNAWNLEYAVRIRNCSRHNQRRSLELDLEGGASASHAISLKPGETRTVRGVLTGLKVEPWSAASPRLYRLTTRLLDGGASVDDLIDRVGFREIRVQGRNLVLNGRPIRLRGYNRHEDHGLFGCALPVEAMAVDLST
jgi:beta-glucuronidase